MNPDLFGMLISEMYLDLLDNRIELQYVNLPIAFKQLIYITEEVQRALIHEQGKLVANENG